MSTSTTPTTDIAGTQLPAKPGTACLGCRRRKLKCSREHEGCANCTKAVLPCVYPVPETGVKRKRGPYKKDKPARERHLEHLVKYLEPRSSAAATGIAQTEGERAQRSPDRRDRSISAGGQADFLASSGINGSTKSESLVKDALIALTKSSTSDRESTTESGGAGPETNVGAPLGTAADLHPPAFRILEYWSIYCYRVDPLTKIIHRPAFIKKLFAAVNNPHRIDVATETLLFSIYYVAVSTCTANEMRRRFGESRDTLLKRYSQVIEDALVNNYSMPALETIQALVLYIIGVRRQDDGTSVATLFGLAVRMAQMIGLNEDPGTKYNAVEAELRRRLWWHICGLESRTAEDHGVRSTSIVESMSVQLPANVNDTDLDPRAMEQPQPRDGITEMTFVRLRWEIMYMVHLIWRAKKRKGANGQPRGTDLVVAEQREIYDTTRTRLEKEYAQYMHRSRPFDWMCIRVLESMLIKTKLVIDYPFGQVPRIDMSREERFHLLQSSVAVISTTHLLAVDRKFEDWHWFFRGYIQWHSLAIVVAELGRSTNKTFTRSAWAVLDPILADWDRMFGAKKDEPAWAHVNFLISRAKQKRHEAEQALGGVLYGAEKRPPEDPRLLGPAASAYTQPSMSSPDQQALINQALSGVPKLGPQTPQTQQAVTPHSLDGMNAAVNAGAGCASLNWDFGADWGSFDGLDQIDFGAFDAVFGGMNWEFPSPEADQGEMGMQYDPNLQAPV